MLTLFCNFIVLKATKLTTILTIKTLEKMTKQEFKSTTKIYKYHNLANGRMSITYANILGRNTVSQQMTVVVEKNGGALNSLYNRYLGW